MLTIGSRVHCILYGGKDGIVYAIHGDQKPDSVRVLGGVMQTGGSADFDIVWEDGTESRRIPECIVLGVQWNLLEGVANAEEITKAREFAASEDVRRKAEAAAEEKVFQDEIAALKVAPQWRYLIPGQTGKNIKAELKRRWPETEFSVRNDHGSTFYVRWTAGPTAKEVESITDKYEAGHFDGMDDCYHYARSPWTEVFGSAQYIFCTREEPKAGDKEYELLKAKVEALEALRDSVVTASQTA